MPWQQIQQEKETSLNKQEPASESMGSDPANLPPDEAQKEGDGPPCCIVLQRYFARSPLPEIGADGDRFEQDIEKQHEGSGNCGTPNGMVGDSSSPVMGAEKKQDPQYTDD